MNDFKSSSIVQFGSLKFHLACVALVLCGASGKAALFADIPGLSTSAQNSLVAYYDGRTGVRTGRLPGSLKTNDVVSWTPVDGMGLSLPSMIVTQTGTGPDIITYDGAGTLLFSAYDGGTSRQLQGTLVAGGSTAYTVFWRGRYLAPAPFEGSGNYVYNIGGELNHQRQVVSGTPAIELFDGSTTHRGTVNISLIDNTPTVWATVYNGNQHRAYADGFNLGIPGTPGYSVGASPPIVIGAFSTAGFNFHGELTDLILFRSALSDADRVLVENYLTKPELAISKAGSNVRITWPGRLTDFTLEAAGEVSSSTWQMVTNAAVASHGKLMVTPAASEPRQFYRLKQ
jgi:hypothetical protein